MRLTFLLLCCFYLKNLSAQLRQNPQQVYYSYRSNINMRVNNISNIGISNNAIPGYLLNNNIGNRMILNNNSLLLNYNSMQRVSNQPPQRINNPVSINNPIHTNNSIQRNASTNNRNLASTIINRGNSTDNNYFENIEQTTIDNYPNIQVSDNNSSVNSEEIQLETNTINIQREMPAIEVKQIKLDIPKINKLSSDNYEINFNIEPISLKIPSLKINLNNKVKRKTELFAGKKHHAYRQQGSRSLSNIIKQFKRGLKKIAVKKKNKKVFKNTCYIF